MSTLSHNRGQERTHDPDQNTPQTLCPQRNREALVNTRQLAQNPHSVRTLAGLKTKIITDSCPSTIESWPTAGQPRHHSEVWSQTRIGIKIHSEILTCTSFWCPALNSSKRSTSETKNIWWISTATQIEETKRTYEDLQVQIHRKITKTPQHRHCFVRQPMIK